MIGHARAICELLSNGVVPMASRTSHKSQWSNAARSYLAQLPSAVYAYLPVDHIASWNTNLLETHPARVLGEVMESFNGIRGGSHHGRLSRQLFCRSLEEM